MINQKGKLDVELINTIEPNFIFKDKPINRFNTLEINNNNQVEKTELLKELKKQINSIENCNLKENSQNLVLGDGNINSPIMLIGEAPGAEEDKSGTTFRGEVGELLNKMLLAIGINRQNIYSSYAINFRPPEDRKPTSQEIKRYSFFLKEHVSQPAFTCRLRWQSGTFVLWDNRICCHHAFNDYDGYRREMYRTTVKGETPA